MDRQISKALEDELTLSFYKHLGFFDEEESIEIVQHVLNRTIYLKKTCTHYVKEIYKDLKNHPVKHMPKILEVIESDDKLIVIEEYISGRTLADIIAEKKERGKFFSDKETISYTLDLITILKELHSRKPAIIHRDIKPSNILISSDATLWLIDLDAAKLENRQKEEDTTLLGTHHHAAPEQYGGFGPSTTLTDIFQIGLLMNEMITGFPDSRSHPATGRLKAIIKKCTELEPKKRYISLKRLESALRGFELPFLSQTEYIGLKSFLPPGFRSLTPWKMLLASTLYYMTFFAVYLSDFSEYQMPQRRLIKLLLCVFVLSYAALFGNYRNMYRYLPPLTSNKLIPRILGLLLYSALFFVFLIFISMIFP